MKMAFNRWRAMVAGFVVSLSLMVLLWVSDAPAQLVDCTTGCHHFTMLYDPGLGTTDEYEPYYAFDNEFIPYPDGGQRAIVDAPHSWRTWFIGSPCCNQQNHFGLGSGSGAVGQWNPRPFRAVCGLLVQQDGRADRERQVVVADAPAKGGEARLARRTGHASAGWMKSKTHSNRVRRDLGFALLGEQTFAQTP